ncbi:centrosomal protein of 72 kDa-like isoform X1 [Ostrea edulis]|uniref:centrosomal protein of 72 kDa-like isoform X1 n=1 Tax=Ostrea edulis TaxID=37623 RepID=UPI0024AF6A31|nr:centrosomal protein of 72 kDa-like isoform X1 [Ostrea edulis]
MALTLSEEVIRNRVNLQHDNLEDVKALSLPGTYHEKVVCLGNSLRKFSRLKTLDLSRNSIASLQGLEHLKLLEKLNLYYNNIETMEELKRLRFNANLKDLDLRLNPITRTEPDYRLYMIHMLPNLQKLDDRGVRDRERQAALVHFSSSQATEMTHHPRQEEPVQRAPNPRAEMIRGVGKGTSALDDDDVAVLDLIARSGGDLSRPRPITGSSAREDQVQEYSLDVLKSMDTEQTDSPREQRSNTPPVEMDERLKSYAEKYPNIPVVNVTSFDDPQSRLDANLQYEDEADAYHKFKSHGYFTPHPTTEVDYNRNEREITQDRPRVPTQRRRSFGEDEDMHQRSNSAPSRKVEEDFGIHRVNGTDQPNSPDESKITSGSSRAMAPETPENRAFLFKVLDLVDRYWNGSKSLHKHAKFKALAYGVIENFMKSDNEVEERRQLQTHLKTLQDENYRLRKYEEATKANLTDSSINETQLKNSLTKAYRDVEQMKEKLQKYVNENRKLSFQVKELEESKHTTISSLNPAQLDDLQRQNEILKSEVEMLQIRLKQFGQVQELASMLQQSHKSLVNTNDHLLKDLEDTKRRHQNEVQQMNWSYEQLKKSMNLSRENTSLAREGFSHGPTRQDYNSADRLSGSALFYRDSDS